MPWYVTAKRDPCTWIGLIVFILVLLTFVLVAVLIMNRKGDENNVVYVYEETNNTIANNSTNPVTNVTTPVNPISKPDGTFKG